MCTASNVMSSYKKIFLPAVRKEVVTLAIITFAVCRYKYELKHVLLRQISCPAFIYRDALGGLALLLLH